MNIHSPRPERSPEAIAERRWISSDTKAMLQHQGYEHSQPLEDIRTRWVIGELTDDEYRAEILNYCNEIAERSNGS